MKEILSGNEAIARGAYENSVKVALAYPGTPSTEILENIAQYPHIKSSWSPNEKVALEVGFGASLGGARTLVAMKHVGLNVAADPFMTLSYTGVGGGLVLVSADDPGMHSSQNEQDNRYYARMAHIPLLEPSDSQECKDYTGLALKISEEFDTPVMLRTTTRVSHSRSTVELGEPTPLELKPYQKNKEKYVMLPGFARLRQQAIRERLDNLREYAETTPLNRLEWGDKEVGIITSGICYQYVKETLPEVSILKLGLTYPIPSKLILAFAAEVKNLFVVEELGPFIEEQLKVMGLNVRGKDLFPSFGELSPALIASKIGNISREIVAYDKEGQLPARPPMLCPGCPHRGVFYALKRLKVNVAGDIGCYTLGALPPLEAMDSCLCMGASIGTALGMEMADQDSQKKTVAVIGDSTFFHSGITPLIDVIYNKGNTTVIILDNSTTAMTGHQEHPGTGKTLRGEATSAIDLETLVKALGVKRVFVSNPLDLEQTENMIKTELMKQEPSVIIARQVCVLKQKEKRLPFKVVSELCTGCKSCLRPGCPAMSLYKINSKEDQKIKNKVQIDPNLCSGCGLCSQLCTQEAIRKHQ
ncbi:MAG: indolepyruvate ferredoxin oxidoreductase subunit alpha [Dethiobacteria bacterium]|jgi:indolepyruvate ferredoxin oxidoreductase alpha subunit